VGLLTDAFNGGFFSLFWLDFKTLPLSTRLLTLCIYPGSSSC